MDAIGLRQALHIEQNKSSGGLSHTIPHGLKQGLTFKIMRTINEISLGFVFGHDTGNNCAEVGRNQYTIRLTHTKTQK